MTARERIMNILLIDKMQENKEIAKKLGLEDKSFFCNEAKSNDVVTIQKNDRFLKE